MFIYADLTLVTDQLPITNKPSAGTLDTSEQTTVTPTTITGMTDHESDENDDRHGCKKILPEDGMFYIIK